MPNLPAQNKVEVLHPDSLPHASHVHLLDALHKLVTETNTEEGGTHDVSQTIHAPVHTVPSHPWLCKYIPGLEKLAVDYHVGNFVVIRETGEKFFESMPIYARIGMHLLFYGKLETALVHNKLIEDQLREQSIREGIVFDSPSSVSSIPSFVKTYQLALHELLIPDIKTGYKCFNEFFYRKLKPDARPVANADNPSCFCSAADCRLTVFENVTAAREFWVKGRNFTISSLLACPVPKPAGSTIPDSSVFEDGNLAIFRLAPADYHRFHSPADVIVGDVVDIPGQYFTVNPQAVNEPGFDVFTANRRAILYLTHKRTGKPIAFVAVGYFAYGGSTVINVFPKGLVNFDKDLVKTSKASLETLMKVGYSLGVQQE